MADVLNVELRESRGTRNARRLRQAGQIPAILYGHGEGSVALTIPQDDVNSVVRHGTKFVDLQGALSENALISEVQWDPFGSEVLHLDLTRVRAGESVELLVPLTVKGTAPGARVGGVVDQAVHEIEVKCPVTDIPESVEVNINKLELGDIIHAGELELPEGIELLTSSDAVILQCIEPTPEEEEEGVDLAAEPEVIGRKEEETED